MTAFLVLAACVTTQTPQFSEEAFLTATTVRAESLALLRQADEQFANHADEAERVLDAANAALVDAAGTPGNADAVQQWKLMTDPDGNLLGGTLARWEEQGTLSRFFRDEVSAQVGKAFDIIICTEEAKREPKACGALAAGGN